jgi:hypothetical protein
MKFKAARCSGARERRLKRQVEARNGKHRDKYAAERDSGEFEHAVDQLREHFGNADTDTRKSA